jgi:hypothetical protein
MALWTPRTSSDANSATDINFVAARMIERDTLANRPAATVGNAGRYYHATDNDTIYVNNAAGVWIVFSEPWQSWQPRIVHGDTSYAQSWGVNVDQGVYRRSNGELHLRAVVTINANPGGYIQPFAAFHGLTNLPHPASTNYLLGSAYMIDGSTGIMYGGMAVQYAFGAVQAGGGGGSSANGGLVFFRDGVAGGLNGNTFQWAISDSIYADIWYRVAS